MILWCISDTRMYYWTQNVSMTPCCINDTMVWCINDSIHMMDRSYYDVAITTSTGEGPNDTADRCRGVVSIALLRGTILRRTLYAFQYANGTPYSSVTYEVHVHGNGWVNGWVVWSISSPPTRGVCCHPTARAEDGKGRGGGSFLNGKKGVRRFPTGQFFFERGAFWFVEKTWFFVKRCLLHGFCVLFVTTAVVCTAHMIHGPDRLYEPQSHVGSLVFAYTKA